MKATADKKNISSPVSTYALWDALGHPRVHGVRECPGRLSDS